MTLQDLLVFALGAVVTAAWMTRRDLLRGIAVAETRAQVAMEEAAKSRDEAESCAQAIKRIDATLYRVEQDFQQVQRTTGFTRYGEQR